MTVYGLNEQGFFQVLNQLASSLDSLRAIANMQVQETTDFKELAALCISIAQIELEKKWED